MTKKQFVLALVVLLMLGPVASAQQPGTYSPTNLADPALNQDPKAEAIGDEYMVSTQFARSTLAAMEVLENGGNAVDAALTAKISGISISTPDRCRSSGRTWRRERYTASRILDVLDLPLVSNRMCCWDQASL